MKQPRRTLHLVSRLDGYGGARMLRQLAASQVAAGGQAIVAAKAAADGVARELEELGVAVQIVGGRWPIDPIAVARLTRLQRTAGASLVHAWDVGTLMQACLSRRAAGHAIVASLDLMQTQRRWAARVVRSFRNRVDAFVAADDATHAWLERHGVAGQQIHKIRAGVPRAAPLSGGRAAWLERLAFPADATVIAVAGPLVRRKSVDEAIWCFELVRVIYSEARMVIIGDGPDRARLERFADEVSEPGCVRFLGYRPDVAELLPYADVFWQLNASPATPLALLEAQAAGVPVVASDVPAHRGAISPGRTGALVPPDNRAEVARATDDLLANPDRAQRMGAAAAVQVAERWSLDAAILSYERLYERTLNAAGK